MEKHRPRKRFGQNFLHDPFVIQEILTAIDPRPHDHFVEIGPGTGALTDPLLTRCAYLDVIELDRDLASRLEVRYSESANLKIICSDALQAELGELLKYNEKIRVIGNLPYNISTPLLFHLLDQRRFVQDMHFMLQREVVDRICAKPGGKTFGKLSIMLQFHFIAEKLFEVSPRSFQPVPKVSSAVIRLKPRLFPDYQVSDFDAFRELVGLAFSQRRKTLRNALKSYLTTDDILLAGIDPSARAETLDIHAYARLSEIFFEKSAAQVSNAKLFSR